MALEADVLAYLRRLRRSAALWRALAIVLAVAAVLVAVARFTGPQRDYVARLTVTGLIVGDARRDKVLDALREEGRAKALIVLIDSPGGTVVGGESLYRRLRAIAAKKPVVAVMGTLATSAGYMIAIAADHVVAHEGSITASIGVVFQATDLTALLERAGIKVEMIRSGPLKASPNPFEKTTPEARAAVDAVVKDAFELFLDTVRERRRLDAEKLRLVADGRVVTGRQARALGLVDALGGEAEALAWLRRERGIDADLKVRDLEIGDRWALAEWLRGLFGGPVDLAGRLALDGLVSLWHPALR